MCFPFRSQNAQGEWRCGMEKVVELEEGQGDEGNVIQLTPSYYILE